MTDETLPSRPDSGQPIISREEAKGLGLKRYYTGEPCAEGHYSEKCVKNNDCIKCRHTRQRDKRESETPEQRQARLLYMRQYTEKNKQKKKEYDKKYREENIKEILKKG